MPDLPEPIPVLSPNPDPWAELRTFTAARIALGRNGTSMPLQESLAFKLAHAHARDAVYSTLAIEHLTTGLKAFNLPIIQLHSQAKTRLDYLQRPDQGRQLGNESRAYLANRFTNPTDISIILGDGLSATAINDHALPLLHLLLPQLLQAGFRLAPITLVEQARVAIGDEIGQLLSTRLTLMLIGERPGLSSPNSLGAYLTYCPRPGQTDESRNCVSNIRPEGLIYSLANDKLYFLINSSLLQQLSGIGLKDNSRILPE